MHYIQLQLITISLYSCILIVNIMLFHLNVFVFISPQVISCSMSLDKYI